ncbi:MAG TPA: EAL domain-containing protein [Streptosporangiaceae bacterium]|nr:EAL domain-containing protein [Streptosporangiaceae bacterium]
MKLPRPARAIVAASIAGGIATLVLASLRQPARVPVGESQWIVASAVGVLLLASWLWPLVVFRGGESEAAHVDECFFVMLALLVPPILALGTLAAAITLAQAIRRRPVVKSAFNAGQVLVAAGLGLAVSRSIAVPSDSLGVAQIAAVTAGVAVFQIVNTALVGGVMAAMGMTLEEFASDLRIQLTLAGGGALAGIVFAMAVRAHIWAITLAIPGLLLGRWLIGARYAALYDRARMEGLYEVALKAHLQLRQQTVLDTILGSVRGLLRSPQATLTPAEPAPGDLSAVMTVTGRRHWLVAAGRRRDEPFDDADHGLLRALAAVGEGALRNAELYQEVHFERERLSSITLNIGEGVCAIDAGGRLTFANPAAADMIDLPLVNVTGDQAADRAVPAPGFLLAAAREAMRTRRAIREDDARFLGKDGRTIPVAYTASAVLTDGQPSGAVIAFRDITERKAFEDELHHHAFYDSLTGLANRRLLVERLDDAVRRSALDRKTHALIFIDVDRFKTINDSLGHVTGDEFLVAIARSMKGVVRGQDLLARFGGDEFVVLLEDVAGPDEAVVAARRICSAVEQPMALPGGYELVATVSVGIAMTDPGKATDDVLRDADVAMYEAKAKGGGGVYKVFDAASMGTRSAQRLKLEADLRKGLERDELEVHYQPFYSLDGKQIVGAEALVRWRHPRNGLIGPTGFIPIAEETGLILPLGRYVLDQACRQVRSIRDRLGVELPVSVNLSPRQFQESGLLSQVAAALDASGLPSASLIFEITESMVMEDLSGARDIMNKLSRLGVRLAIDDFGTGHSSLAYLKQFPVHEVKVDRAFVKGLGRSRVDLAIVRAVIDLANAIGISAVAEGVETLDQVAGLRTLGYRIAQGYFFSHPLPAKEFEDLLTGHFARDAAPFPVESGLEPGMTRCGRHFRASHAARRCDA